MRLCVRGITVLSDVNVMSRMSISIAYVCLSLCLMYVTYVCSSIQNTLCPWNARLRVGKCDMFIVCKVVMRFGRHVV